MSDNLLQIVVPIASLLELVEILDELEFNLLGRLKQVGEEANNILKVKVSEEDVMDWEQVIKCIHARCTTIIDFCQGFLQEKKKSDELVEEVSNKGKGDVTENEFLNLLNNLVELFIKATEFEKLWTDMKNEINTAKNTADSLNMTDKLTNILQFESDLENKLLSLHRPLNFDQNINYQLFTKGINRLVCEFLHETDVRKDDEELQLELKKQQQKNRFLGKNQVKAMLIIVLAFVIAMLFITIVTAAPFVMKILAAALGFAAVVAAIALVYWIIDDDLFKKNK